MSTFSTTNIRSVLVRADTSCYRSRTIDLQEHSFNYERAPKYSPDVDLVQSPYVNGRKNQNYLSPTFHSSSILNQSMELQRAKTPEANRLSRSNSQNRTAQTKTFSVQANNEGSKPEPAPETHVVDKERPKSVSITQKFANDTATAMETGVAGLASCKSATYIDVCGTCYNSQLAIEGAELKRKAREKEKELEKSVVEYSNKLLQGDKEREQKRREMNQATLKANCEASELKRTKSAVRKNLDLDKDEVDVKPDNKYLTDGSVRSLKRYQSMLDKMYETSVKRNSEYKSQDMNKSLVMKKSQVKGEEKQQQQQQQQDCKEDVKKSILDTFHERETKNTTMRSVADRNAFEYNCKMSAQKREASKSPVAVRFEDPFKGDTTSYEKGGDGKSLLDKLHANSLEFWKRQKERMREDARANLENSMTKKKRNQYEEDGPTKEYQLQGRGLDSFTQETMKRANNKSLLDTLHNSDEKGKNKRREQSRGCLEYNKSLSYCTEGAQTKVKAMESYEKNLIKKIGKGDELDYDGWTFKDKGMLHKINNDAEKTKLNRKTLGTEIRLIIEQQMQDFKQKRKEQKELEKSFKETPLLCSHNANMMQCAICNKKVPTKQISKIIAKNPSNAIKQKASG